MKLRGNMAKFLILCGLLLVASFSRSAPILDEEVEHDFDDNEDEIQDEGEERMNEANDDDYKSNNARDDYDDDEGPDLKRKDDEEDDYNEDKEVDVSEKQDLRELNGDDDDDELEESEEQIIDAAGKNVVEDSEGKMALEKITDIAGDDDDDDEEGGEDEMDEANVEDMDTKLSEIKKIFNDYMPKEIEGLKRSSETLKNDLDNLNAKLDNFLTENGIKRDPAVPKADGENDYLY